MEVGPNHSFTRMGSFRQASLTERLEDPQIVMPANDPVPFKQVDNPHAIERPRPKPDGILHRQNSLRGTSTGTGTLQMPTFKRNSNSYQSLRPGELPSFQQIKLTNNTTTSNVTKTSLLMQQHQMNQNSSSSNTTSQNNNNNVIETNPIYNKINTISEIPEEQLNSNTNLTKVNEQLNIQTSFNSPITPTSNVNDWPGNSLFQLNTPQSLPITPPPLPPMPTTNTTPVTSLIQTPLTLQQQQQLQLQLQQQQQFIYQQQLQLQHLYNNTNNNTNNQLVSPLAQMMPMMNINQLPAVNPMLASPSSQLNTSNNQNETFEQKWARIQAAKKTNPFAEDIAKKFEIKL